ncbi:MAG: conjugative transfer signal peptidase TraF [Pseudomonadota bacterium]
MKFLRYFSLVLICFIACGGICLVAGIRVNTSESIPLGIYRSSEGPVKKGDFVLFCPPPSLVFDMAKERGYLAAGLCPSGYGYMMKDVVGTSGDIIAFLDDGVHVNGVLLPKSRPLKADPAGRPLPQHFQADSYTLGRSEVLLMSDVCGLSFDGRYFGPIDRLQIKTVILPVFTW